MHLNLQFASLLEHVGVFHHQHRVGAPRNHAARGKNRCRPLRNRLGGFHSRRQHLPVQPQQPRAVVRRSSRIRRAHRKPVHIRPVEARHIHLGDNLPRQHAPQRLRQSHPLLTQRPHPQMRPEALFRLVPAHHFQELLLPRRPHQRRLQFILARHSLLNVCELSGTLTGAPPSAARFLRG